MSAHHRPGFHVRPASGWVNDPNAPVHVDGTYHLFCQHNPGGTEHGDVHWAHFSSQDLVHWTTHPIALAPRPGGPDADGCWSGSAVLVDGEPWLVYSGRLDAVEHETVCVARPLPGHERWAADPEAAVMQSPPEAADLAVFRDPFVWRDGDGFRMLVGAGYRNGTGLALQYRSDDLRAWTPLGPFCTAAHPVVSGRDTGDAWECPQLLRRDERGLLVLSVWRTEGGPSHVDYVSGRLVGDRLEPEGSGRLDHGPDFYAPALTVDATGRCLLWGWVWEARDAADVELDGWAGLLTVPRVLGLAADGTPRMLPAPELSTLRGDGSSAEVRLQPGAGQVLDAGAGSALDVEARLVPGPGGQAWLRVLADPGGAELTEIGVDGAGQVYLSRDRSSARAGTHGGTYRMPVGLDGAGGVDLRVLVDASVVEVFAADGHALTARVYPESRLSTALVVGADDAPGTASVRWWQVRTQGRSTAPTA